jgi:hypothetical protein
MVDPRKQALEDFAKKVELGDYSTTTMVSPEKTLFNQGLSARDVAEKTLAKKVLDNTGISIPDNGSIKQLEEFLGRVAKERYPEIDPNIRILQENEKNYLKGNKGLYGKLKSGSPIIALNRKILQSGDILDPVATLLHELGHQYDEEQLGYELPKELKNINNKSQLSKEKAYALAKKSLPRSLDPSDFYEAAAEGHHASIPKLREGSYGLGALKSYLKSGTFKGIAPILAKGVAAGAGGLVSLASEAAGAESTGEAPEQAAMLRDIDQSNREKKILEAIPEQNRQQVQKDLEDQRLGIKRNVLEGMLRK